MDSPPSTLRLALVQMRMSGQSDDNMQRAACMVERAAGEGAELICLPELYRTPYLCQIEHPSVFDQAETIPGPSTKLFSDIARRLEVVVVVPLFERRAAGVYHNSAVIIDRNGAMAGSYRKMHIPDDPGYYEKYYFTPGDLGYRVFPTSVGRIGVGICWDQWFPEAARMMTLGGADVLLYPTAIGWHPHEEAAQQARQRDAWITVQRGHAIANGIYVAAVNRTGFERSTEGVRGLDFWGTSFIAGPQGELLAEASVEQETVLHAILDLSHMERVRREWPFLRDRRIESYGDLAQRHLLA